MTPNFDKRPGGCFSINLRKWHLLTVGFLLDCLLGLSEFVHKIT